MQTNSFFLKYHPLHQNNVLAYVLCHVTYVTVFIKCSDLDVNPAKSVILYNMSKTGQIHKIPCSSTAIPPKLTHI